MKIQNGALAPTGSACLEKVLARLDKVKTTGRSKWIACCPAHDDRDPSLSITEANDGKVLLKCWAGCTAAEIVEAIGLGLRDLFPDNGQYQGRPARKGPSRQAVDFERKIVAVATALKQRGETLNEKNQARLELARRRLEAMK